MSYDNEYSRAYYRANRERLLARLAVQRRANGVPTKGAIPLADRFWRHVEKTGGCWLWRGATDQHGYGRVGAEHKPDGPNRAVLAHRVAYELTIGPIGPGMVLDHLCRVPACVNPHHLEQVTQAENCRRGLWAMRTHCPKGHAYDDVNTYRDPSGGRRCHECRRERDRAS